MPNFVDDLTSLAYPKSDRRPLPAGADPLKWIVAVDWNDLCQAAIDLRGGLLADRADLADLTADVATLSAGSVPNARTITAGVGLSGGGDLSANRTIDLEDTAVAPGAYTYAGFTVDAQGRLTAAASGAAPALAARTITAGTGLSGGGDLSADRTIALANIATDRLLGRDTAGSGSPEELTVGGGLEFTGSGGIQRSALTGDVTAAAGSGATTIANDAVTYAKLQNVSATDRLLGRDTAAAGDVEELTVGGGLEFTGAGGIQRSALTGDVTAAAGSGATTIANDAVSYAKLQNISATQLVLGRNTAGAGDAEEVSASGVFDWIGSTRGQILYRGASGWAALAPGTAGYVLATGGAGADPSWSVAALGSVGGSGVGSIAISDAAGTSGAKNISTEGTIDWLSANNLNERPSRIAGGSLHAKAKGHWLARSFEWVWAGTAASLSAWTSGMTAQSTASDDLATAALNSTSGTYIPGGASNTGHGFTFSVPAIKGAARTLKIYSTIFAATVTFAASFSDGTATPQSTTRNQATGTGAERTTTITFTGGSDNSELIVTVLVTTNNTNGNVGFIAITLA